jgi:hypothetical protein
MLSQSQLDERLQAWTREYGWGGLPDGMRGRNVLQRLIDHKGYMPERVNPPGPQNQTWGDEVQQRVVELQTSPPDPRDPHYTYRIACVLQAEHLTPSHWPVEERLRRLEPLGVVIGRTRYFELLKLGHLYLRTAIRSHGEVA